MRRILIVGGFAIVFFLPGVRSNVKSVIDLYLSDLLRVVGEVAKPEVLRAYNFGLKVMGLIGAWFVGLFCLELIMRAVAMIVVALLRTVGILPKRKIRVVKINKRSTVAADKDSDDGEEEDDDGEDTKNSAEATD